MPRRMTETERATTPRGEDFLASPILRAGLEALAELARTTLGEHRDARFPFGAIRDGAAILAAKEYEAWIISERLRTADDIRRLQKQIQDESA